MIDPLLDVIKHITSSLLQKRKNFLQEKNQRMQIQANDEEIYKNKLIYSSLIQNSIYDKSWCLQCSVELSFFH